MRSILCKVAVELFDRCLSSMVTLVVLSNEWNEDDRVSKVGNGSLWMIL